jgi:hypothetical protein
MGARLDAALSYADQARSIIPVEPGGKLPAIEWKRYQAERATPSRIEHWWQRADWNVGVVTGQISNLVVVDVDHRHGGSSTLAKLQADHGCVSTAEVATPNGVHLWFAHPGGRRIPNSAGLLGPGLDVRGDGGFVVAPPSIRGNGAYSWCGLFEQLASAANLPAWLESLLAPPRSPRPTTVAAGAVAGDSYLQAAIRAILGELEHATEGRRNNLVFWAACRVLELRRQGAPTSWIEVVRQAGFRLVAGDFTRTEVEKAIASAHKRVGP